jgi:ketosteroid isomerase-like protein
MSDRVEEPQQMNAAFAAAYNSGEIENLLALYERDAILAPQPGLRAHGIAQIREALTEFLALKGSMHSENVYCMRSGDIAMLQGSWKLAGVGGDGKPFEIASLTAEVVRRQPHGGWLYVIDHSFQNDTVGGGNTR